MDQCASATLLDLVKAHRGSMVPGILASMLLVRSPNYLKRTLTNPGIFALGVEKTSNKSYIAGGRLMSTSDIMKIFTRVTGKKAYYDPITYEEFADMAGGVMGPALRQCVLEMKQWAGETPEGRINYGCSEIEEDISAELGASITPLEEWLQASDFVVHRST
jgi:hypothetical protein